MVKHTPTSRRQIADELLIVLDHFMGLVLKGLKLYHSIIFVKVALEASYLISIAFF